MTIVLALRAAVIWLGIVCLAVGNGVIRENIIAPKFGEAIALPLSGLSLSFVIFLVAYFTFDFIGGKGKSTSLLVGVQWLLMTLAFEFIFGHFVAGKSLSALLQIFNIAKGDLFTLVLLVSLLSPYIVYRIKGIDL